MKVFYGWIIVGAGINRHLHRARRHALPQRLPGAHVGRDGLVPHGHLDCRPPHFLSMGIGSFFWGALSDRFGTRAVVLCGACCCGLGLVTASQAATLGQFQILFGVIVGFAGGSLYTPMTGGRRPLVHRHRSLAVAVVSAGSASARRRGASRALAHHQLTGVRPCRARRPRVARHHSQRVCSCASPGAVDRAVRPGDAVAEAPSSRWRRRFVSRSSRPSRSRSSRAARALGSDLPHGTYAIDHGVPARQPHRAQRGGRGVTGRQDHLRLRGRTASARSAAGRGARAGRRWP